MDIFRPPSSHKRLGLCKPVKVPWKSDPVPQNIAIHWLYVLILYETLVLQKGNIGQAQDIRHTPETFVCVGLNDFHLLGTQWNVIHNCWAETLFPEHSRLIIMITAAASQETYENPNIPSWDKLVGLLSLVYIVYEVNSMNSMISTVDPFFKRWKTSWE